MKKRSDSEQNSVAKQAQRAKRTASNVSDSEPNGFYVALNRTGFKG